MIQEALTFDDVLLVPKYSEIESRKEVDISSDLGFLKLDLPIISSPMDTVTEDEMAITMGCHGGLGIIHRYCTIERQVEMVKKKNDVNCPVIVGAAIGATGDFLERADALIQAGAQVICVDVAHGDHIVVKRALEALNKFQTRPSFHLMAGNIASGAGFIRLAQWGVDSIRVGIGGGSICSTRINTGFGVPNLSAIFDCVNEWNNWHPVANPSNKPKKPSLIIDGGVKTAGDIVKALAAGADFVMCGSMLAATKETPGEIVNIGQGMTEKSYRGMASKEAQEAFKGTWTSKEGIATFLTYKGSVVPILNDLAGNIRSGFSYAGARNINELRQKAQFIKQTHAGQRESFTHILNR